MNPAHQRYLPLDGLRAIAIAGVFWFHYRVDPHSAGQWGWAGVDLFFALSGYLITGILFDSLHKPGYFRNFYLRRALRIFPLYWAVWLLIGLAALMVPQGHADAWYLAWPLYLGNYVDLHAMHTGLPHLHYDIPLLIHAVGEKFFVRVGPYWSLCVEEQYYLVWPLVVWLVRDRVRLLQVCIGGMVAILALRIALHLTMPAPLVEHNEVYFWTFTRADTLLAGALIALWSRGPRGMEGVRTGWVLGASGAALGLLVASAWRFGQFTGSSFAGWMQTYGFTLIGLVAAGLLVAALKVGWFARILTFRPLVQLGQVSYGFYLFHLLFFDCDRIPMDAISSPALRNLIHWATFALVWGVSSVSFRYFETPFLRLKDRWTARSVRPVIAVAASPEEVEGVA